MKIRLLEQNDDLYEISSIYENSWKYAYKDIIPQDYLDSIPEGRWAKGINREGMRNLVVTDNNKYVGTAGFCRSRWEKYSDYGELVSIYFLPEYIGKGYGKHLLDRCLKELKEMGFDRVLLWVLEDNIRARRFYSKNGFICTDEFIDDNIGGKNLREVMYIKDISDNPWNEISLSDYENHMKLSSVSQLQSLNNTMKMQLDDYDAESAVILGVAGGNGLEHVDPVKYHKVYGVDINSAYLSEVQNRYAGLKEILKCVNADIVNNPEILPESELLIADLIIEYIGYDAFIKALKIIKPVYVSCVIQNNDNSRQWVSDSPYIHAFDNLDSVHTEIEEDILTECMIKEGYRFIKMTADELPNGKSLVRIDYEKTIFSS